MSENQHPPVPPSRGRPRGPRFFFNDSGRQRPAPHGGSASGDPSAVAPPVPIPNTEVKRCSPDDSASIGRAKVGRRQSLRPAPCKNTRRGALFLYRVDRRVARQWPNAGAAPWVFCLSSSRFPRKHSRRGFPLKTCFPSSSRIARARRSFGSAAMPAAFAAASLECRQGIPGFSPHSCPGGPLDADAGCGP